MTGGYHSLFVTGDGDKIIINNNMSARLFINGVIGVINTNIINNNHIGGIIYCLRTPYAQITNNKFDTILTISGYPYSLFYDNEFYGIFGCLNSNFFVFRNNKLSRGVSIVKSDYSTIIDNEIQDDMLLHSASDKREQNI